MSVVCCVVNVKEIEEDVPEGSELVEERVATSRREEIVGQRVSHLVGRRKREE